MFSAMAKGSKKCIWESAYPIKCAVLPHAESNHTFLPGAYKIGGWFVLTAIFETEESFKK